ncbi:3'-5' exonuclease-like [Arachis stenosperma]|uniref:3'-5' exonuclease-like n=1 Tax=Arachis stenosperma TaxID=217475 RepID=UPI0025AD2942|nr:3'-5' exonuclease-like [Arachis stenosperma]
MMELVVPQPNLSVIIALNVEWCNYYKPATLHLCIDKKCLIVQLIYIDKLPLSLKNFLMNPNFFFVGFSFAEDISKINNEHGLNCGGVRADIKDLAVRKWPVRWNRSSLTLKDLAMDVVGLSIKKPNIVSLSNWDIRVLSIEQVEYGCIDAYVSYKVGQKLLRDD